jgi:hypothetical protein
VNEPFEVPSGIQRTISAIRAALPWVQRILPLLDGNIGTAVSNMMGPHHRPSPPAQPVNLAPIHDSLAELQSQQLELRDQVVEQNSSLKRVEDQLEMVREATDRNTLEQQELMEHLSDHQCRAVPPHCASPAVIELRRQMPIRGAKAFAPAVVLYARNHTSSLVAVQY